MRAISFFGLSLAAGAAALAVQPAVAGDTRDAVRGGLIGGAGGAAVGALVPGVSVGTGALVGAAGGAVIGATSKNKRYYRDRNGDRYWVDGKGRRRY